MKWFQMDSDAPERPTARRVRRVLGNDGLGALWQLWCWVAAHGRREIGRAVDDDGKPYDVDTLIDVTGLSEERFDLLVTALLDTEHIERDAWEQRRELSFPWLLRCSDEYTKRRMGKLGSLSETVPTPAGANAPTRQDSTSTEREAGASAPLLFPVPDSPRVQAERIREDWNHITTLPIARCQALNDNRVRRVLARVREHGREGLQNVFRLIEGSRFCRGENERGWVASLDWAMQPDVPLKVLEGKYANRPQKKPGTGSGHTGGSAVPDVDQTTAYLTNLRKK